MNRREFLEGLIAAAAALIAFPRKGIAFGDASRLVFAQGRHGGEWQPRPSALRRLAFEIGVRTSIQTAMQERQILLDSQDLFQYPFLYLAGGGELPPLSQAEVENLRRYVTYGGFILCDAADGETGTFVSSCEREMSRIFSGQAAGRIPAEHVVYKSFYLVDQPAGRLIARPYMTGFMQGPRLGVVICANDLGGAWARDEIGGFAYEVIPGGELQREIAFRLGVNIVMYAMCTDYKDDQVHIPFIMKRRQ